MAKRRDPAVTSRIMAAVRSKDTTPEMVVRRALWARGYRYRVHYKRVPGKPDIAFPGLRLAVFIDGDFWHGNAWRVRELDSLEDLFPTRTDWWVSKIERNMERDEEVNQSLRDSGWTVLRVWESEVETDLEAVLRKISLAVEQQRNT